MARCKITNACPSIIPMPPPLAGELYPEESVIAPYAAADVLAFIATQRARQGLPAVDPRFTLADVDSGTAVTTADLTADDLVVDTVVAGTATVSALTAGRVAIAGTAGVLADDADLTFATATLTATNAVVTTALTQGASGSMAAGSGGISTTGDLSAAGGFRSQIGPHTVTMAADQTNVVLRPAGVANAPGWVAQRAGSIVGFSAALNTAVTGSAKTATVSVRINGTIVAAANLAFTSAGSEVEARYAVAKDVALHTFAAGDNIDVSYTSDTITSTPVCSAWIEIEQ